MKYISAVLAVLLVFSGVDAFSYACSAVATPVSFNGYDTFAPFPTDARGDIRVTCETGMPFTVRLGAGNNSGGFNPRTMLSSSGGFTLGYNLYRDSARTQVWGDGTGVTFTQSGAGTGSDIVFLIYGRIHAGQNSAAGLYGDAVTVTVEW